MRGAIPLLPQYVFMGLCLVKHRNVVVVVVVVIINTMKQSPP
jgi:hypothetical protein